MNDTITMRPVCLVLALAAAAWLALVPAPALCGGTPDKGDTLPVMNLPAPDREQDAAYLGLDSMRPFAPSEAAGDLLIIDVIGVYCPICHDQAPTLRKIFKRLTREKDLAAGVRLVSLAVGATPPEIAYVRDKHKAEYPILNDVDMSLHALLGEPKTPFLMIVAKDGKVLYSHLGKIESDRDFVALVRSLLP